MPTEVITGDPREIIIDANDSSSYKLIAQGDDGIVHLNQPEETRAIKVFLSNTIRSSEPASSTDEAAINFYKEISKDQANREIKALILLRDHDNFMKPALDEIQYVTYITEETRARHENIPCLQTYFVPHLYDVTYLTEFFGFKHDENTPKGFTPTLKTKNRMNFEHRNILFKYTMHQLFDATIKMREVGIKHRDLDICNVNMTYPSFTLKIMDFARSDIPRVSGFPDSEDPLSIIGTARSMLRKNVLPRETRPLWEYCITQYENPLNYDGKTPSRKTPMFKEQTDNMEVVYFLDRILEHHLKSFRWCEDSINGETIIQENDLLINYINYCNQIPLSQALAVTTVDRAVVAQIPCPIHADWVKEYMKRKKVGNTYRDQSNFLLHPRVVVHSKAWETRYAQDRSCFPF